jgi:hypothetical protein
MKMKRSITGVLLIISMLCAILFVGSTSLKVHAAGRLPKKNERAFIHIQFHEPGALDYIYSSEKMKKETEYAKKIATIKGIKYDKKTNTLTLSNFNRPKSELTIVGMGTKPTVKLVGKNRLRNIIFNAGSDSSGKMNSMTATFTGNGELALSNQYSAAIFADTGKIVFDKKVTVNAKSKNSSNGTIWIQWVKRGSGDGIKIKGKCNKRIMKDTTFTTGEYYSDCIKGAVKISKK